MISAILYAMLLGGPCDGGQCVNAILPRHVVSVTVTAVVKAPAIAIKGAKNHVCTILHRTGIGVAKAARAVVGHQRRAERRQGK